MRSRTLWFATVLLCAPIVSVAQHGPAPAATGPLTPAAVRADLATMREQFLATEAAFSPESRAEAGRRLARLESAADTVQRAYLEIELARIVALADNGHTGVPAAMRSGKVNRVGMRLTPFGEDFYVLRVLKADADLLGARLVSIDGAPIAQLRSTARSLAGGTNAWRDRGAPFLFESPELLQTVGIAKSRDAATYQFALANGKSVSKRMVAVPPVASGFANSNQWMYPAATVSSSGEWVSLLSDDRAPWSLKDPTTRFRWREAPEIDGVVIELRQNVSAPGLPIRTFLLQMDTMLRARKPANIVLDLRMNGGGDLNTTRAFVQSLPTLTSGRVFVLTSPYTFSAAISTTGYLKQAAPERVSIVGESVGDRLVFWAEGSPVMLPNVGIMIGKTSERHDYETGCTPYTDCHGPVVRNPIRVKTLSPDIVAPWTIEQFRAGNDPAIAAVSAALKK